MHYLNIVIIKADQIDQGDTDSIEHAVRQAMGPHEDEGGFYDWFQIGGRWTGYFDSYDPTKDLRNLEECSCCKGTGNRDDEIGKKARLENPAYRCNGCNGTGQQTSWPTNWASHKGDSMPAENLTQQHIDGAYRIVIAEWDSYGGNDFCFRPWIEGAEALTVTEREKPPLDWIKANFGAGYLAVVVDNHQ